MRLTKEPIRVAGEGEATLPEGYEVFTDKNGIVSWRKDPNYQPPNPNPDAWYQSILSIWDKRKLIDQKRGNK